MARKPLVGTVAANVSRYGTGALNIDATRLAPMAPDDPSRRGLGYGYTRPGDQTPSMFAGAPRQEYDATKGRWPANVVLSHVSGPGGCREVGTRKVKGAGWKDSDKRTTMMRGNVAPDAGNGKHHTDADGTETVSAWVCHPNCPVRLLDEQSGERKTGKGGGVRVGLRGNRFAESERDDAGYGDTGGASRFYYTAKASRREREAGLEGMPAGPGVVANDSGRRFNPICDKTGKRIQVCDCGSCEWTEATNPRVRNGHPTVKPLALMRWLCRLITPPGGLILDPFAGSGSTLCAGVLEGFRVLGIEAEPEYVTISERRLAYWSRVARRYQRFRQYLLEHPRPSASRAPVDPDQGSLFSAHPETEGPP